MRKLLRGLSASSKLFLARPARRTSLFSILGWVIFCAVVVAGCAAKLAPDYEKAIVDGLTSANEGAMTLFAAASPSAPKGTFAKREDIYNSVIGKFEAVRVQVATRPAPVVSPLVTRVISIGQNSGDQKQIEIPAAPTSEIIARIVVGLTMMRDTDRVTGLPAMLIPGFKREYEALIEQALFYEKQLQR